MNSIVSSLVLGISSNLDNLSLGFAYGMQRIKIRFGSNLFIAVVTSLVTAVSLGIGRGIKTLLSPEHAAWVGGGILAAMGIYIIGEAAVNFRKKDAKTLSNRKLRAKKSIIQQLNFPDTVSLAIALSASNVGTGIGAGVAGLNIWLTSGMVLILSLVTLGLGAYLGKNLATAIRISPQWATMISGLLIAALGVNELMG